MSSHSPRHNPLSGHTPETWKKELDRRRNNDVRSQVALALGLVGLGSGAYYAYKTYEVQVEEVQSHIREKKTALLEELKKREDELNNVEQELYKLNKSMDELDEKMTHSKPKDKVELERKRDQLSQKAQQLFEAHRAIFALKIGVENELASLELGDE